MSTRAVPRLTGRRTRWVHRGGLAVALAAAGLALAGGRAAAPVAAATGVPVYDHIFLVLEENHGFSQTYGSAAPYLTALANANGLATNYHAVTHPSVNNYLALVSGQTYSSITDSCTVGSGSCDTGAPNVADEIEAAGRTWKGYMESMPSACYGPHDAGAYTERHNPFPYFNQIRTNPARCARDVPYTQLASDLGSASTTPNLVWITPNLNDDMHDGTIQQGDTWAKGNFPVIFSSPAWKTQHSLLLVTWDEDQGTSANTVETIAVSSDGTVPPGTKTATNYTHYSLLRTIEASWGLHTMEANDGAASPMADMFGGTAHLAAPPPPAPRTAAPKAAAPAPLRVTRPAPRHAVAATPPPPPPTPVPTVAAVAAPTPQVVATVTSAGAGVPMRTVAVASTIAGLLLAGIVAVRLRRRRVPAYVPSAPFRTRVDAVELSGHPSPMTSPADAAVSAAAPDGETPAVAAPTSTDL